MWKPKWEPELLERGKAKDIMLNRWIRENTMDAHTVVDFGAGQFLRTRMVNPAARKIGIEIFPPYASLAPSDVRCVLGDFRNWERFVSGSESDVAMMIDTIEHIPKQDGIELIKGMQQRFRRILIFTPDGFYPQFGDELGHENEFQVHECGWTREEFEELGFRVEVDTEFHVLKGGQGAIFAIWEMKK